MSVGDGWSKGIQEGAVSTFLQHPPPPFDTLPHRLTIAHLPPQEVEGRNVELEQQLQDVEQTLVDCVNDRERVQHDARKLLDILDVKLYELNDLRQGLAKIAEKEEKS